MPRSTSLSVATMGIDIGKNSFHVVGLDQRGAIVVRQRWTRSQIRARLANMSPCLIGMEACVGAHHLSRRLHSLGHDARLMPAKYVKPYRKGQKNDFRDAEAIAEAVQRPTMRFVATKTADQLDLQALHRVRAPGQPAYRHHQPDPCLLAGARHCSPPRTALPPGPAPRGPRQTHRRTLGPDGARDRGSGSRLAPARRAYPRPIRRD